MSKASSNTYHISPLLAFPSMEKLSSAKLVPGAKKVGDHCYMEKTRPKDNGMHVQLLQSCPTLCDPMDCSPPCSSVHEILQARILEWVVMPSSRRSSNPAIESMSLESPALGGGFFTTSAIWEAPLEGHNSKKKCDRIYVINLERSEETCILATPTDSSNSASVAIRPSRDTGQ